MIIVDTSAWIEWLIDSPTGTRVSEHLPEQADWLVPTMVQLELAKWLTRDVGGGGSRLFRGLHRQPSQPLS